MMRHLFFAAFFLSSVQPAAYADDDFSGVWTATVCPSGMRHDPGKCSHFVLELFQRNDTLCGAHLFATPGAAQIDEGTVPSLQGSIADNVATVRVASIQPRAGGPVQAELKMANGRLQWHRLDKPGKHDLLPVNAQFARSRAKTYLNPVFAQQLSAACTMIANPAPEQSAPAPIEAPPQRPQPHFLRPHAHRLS